MIEERSAGAVVFLSANTKTEYLLLDNGGRLDLPKGQIESGEDEIAAAKRETKEETGLSLEFVDGFKERVNYFYAKRGGERVHKTVTFFVAKSESTDVKISDEHQGYVWLPLDEAVRKASYGTTKSLLRRADNFVRDHQMQSNLGMF